MSVGTIISDAWRKNAPEIAGWWSGSLPRFVTTRRALEPLDGVPVFCYHLVESAKLEADLKFLKDNGYRTLGADEFVGYLTAALDVGPRAVVLTFDDGPRNFYDVAFPLLTKYSARAVAFIAPGLHADAGPDDDAVAARPMTWREIRAIHDSGLVDFESHTFESRYVPDWPRPAALAGCDPAIEDARRRQPTAFKEDIADSRAAIAAQLPAAAVEHLSFPMYIGNEAAVRTAQSLGFKACHWGLIEGRPLNRRGDSPFYISRLSDEFLRRLPGDGRVSMIHLLRERLHRARTARAWRRQFPARA
jgi:peptidoglycan/xylan/chitin deacetylase (PgdA/CDA1 family)